MTAKLLIDGDVLVYRAALSAEYNHEWDEYCYTLEGKPKLAEMFIDDSIDEFKGRLESDDVVVALSCPQHNFRKDIYPEYKSHRKKDRRPILYQHCRDYIDSKYGAKIMYGLEGDDVLGILGTLDDQHTIIVSIDKDFKTVPCPYYNIDTDIVIDPTPESAHEFHMIQTLMGDATDGYKGCDGVGPKTAMEAILNRKKLVPYEHMFKSGKRKGEITTRHSEEFTDDLWSIVVSYYVKSGMTEDEALVQARLARILQACDYDFKKKEVKLWEPD